MKYVWIHKEGWHYHTLISCPFVDSEYERVTVPEAEKLGKMKHNCRSPKVPFPARRLKRDD